MSHLKFTRSAREDLKDIGKYTARVWGGDQRKKYLASIMARCHWLAENPGLGIMRNEIKEGYRSYPEGQHVIFFRVVKNEVQILRIPHQRMDVIQALDE